MQVSCWPEGELAYVTIGKTATTSVLYTLALSAGMEILPNKSPHCYDWHVLSLEHARSLGLYVFTTVRNPYNRLLSLWVQVASPGYEPKHHVLDADGKSVLYDGMPFYQFAYEALRIPPQSADPHYRPQYLLTDNFNGIDQLLRVETLARDWAQLQRKAKQPLRDIEWHNRSQHGSCWQYYTPYLMSMVQEYYAQDFAMLGYSTELPP